MEIITAQAMSLILTNLSSKGIVTSQHNDFSKFRKTARKINGKGPSEQFLNASHNLLPSNAFWIEWQVDGTPIAAHAFRMENCEDTNLHNVWGIEQERIYHGGTLGNQHPPLTKKMTGKIVYAGDFELVQEYRGGNLAEAMILLSFFVVELKWRPDWIYGFMNPQLVTRRGFHSRVGYSHAEPRGTHWRKPPKGINPNDWLVALDRNGLIQRIGIIASLGLEGMTGMQ